MSRLAVCLPVLLLSSPAWAQRLSLSTRSTWYTRLIDLGLGWFTLLLTVIFVVFVWKRVQSWSQSRLEPALDALRLASGELAARSAGTEMTPFSRHKHANGTLLPLELYGERWVEPGQFYNLESSEDNALAHVVVGVLDDPNTAVIVVSNRVQLSDIASQANDAALGRMEGRLFAATPSSLGTMPEALLYDAARAGHLPIMVIDDAALISLGASEPFSKLAGLLKPAAGRLHGSAIVVSETKPKYTKGYDRTLKWNGGQLS